MKTKEIIEALATMLPDTMKETSFNMEVDDECKEIKIPIQGFLRPAELKALAEIAEEFDLFTYFTSEFDSEFIIHLFENYDKSEA